MPCEKWSWQTLIPSWKLYLHRNIHPYKNEEKISLLVAVSVALISVLDPYMFSEEDDNHLFIEFTNIQFSCCVFDRMVSKEVHITPIVTSFDVRTVLAPAVSVSKGGQAQGTQDTVLVCGHSMEINFVSDVNLYISNSQVSTRLPNFCLLRSGIVCLFLCQITNVCLCPLSLCACLFFCLCLFGLWFVYFLGVSPCG